MAKIQHKRSLVLDGGVAKEPTAGQTEFGELCVNYSTTDPALFIKDDTQGIRRVGGDLSLYQKIEDLPPTVEISPNPPTSPEDGDLWWNSSDDSGRLYVYYEDANSSQWVEASPQGETLTEGDADGLYLSKVNNDTAAGEITFEKVSTHEGGVNVTGSGFVANGLDFTSDVLQLRYESQPLVQLRKNGVDDYRVRFTARQQVDYTSVNDAPVFSILPKINGQSTWNTDIFSIKPTLTGTFNSLIGLNLDFKEGIAAGTSITANNFYGVKLERTNQITGKLYGVYTEVEGNTNYNFYTAGDAPNYFAGITTVSTAPTAINSFKIYPDGRAVTQITGNASAAPPFTVIRANSSALGSWSGISLRKANATGNNQNTLSVIALNGSTSRMIDSRLGATGVAMPDGAANIVKLIQPKVITQGGDTFNGFLPVDLTGTFAAAVSGEAGATTSIGTYTTPEGVVETEVEEPEAIPFGATWVQTGTRDDMQGVCREELIPLLTKALQEVITKNEELETRLAALEGA